MQDGRKGPRTSDEAAAGGYGAGEQAAAAMRVWYDAGVATFPGTLR